MSASLYQQDPGTFSLFTASLKCIPCPEILSMVVRAVFLEGKINEGEKTKGACKDALLNKFFSYALLDRTVLHGNAEGEDEKCSIILSGQIAFPNKTITVLVRKKRK